MTSGRTLELRAEKPVAGGAMLARIEGRAVLVSGAIPGELVRARIDREHRQLIHATVCEVLEPDADRRAFDGDPACGGHVYRHIAYPRQLRLKTDVVRDALARIGKCHEMPALAVVPSPEHGYRMRAKLHPGRSGLGFLREGTHRVCDVAQTGQLLDATVRAVTEVGRRLVAAHERSVAYLELSENMAGDQRVMHVVLRRHTPPRVMLDWVAGSACTGATYAVSGTSRVETLVGTPTVTDPVTELAGGSTTATLRRHAASFFQVNRFVLPALVDAVCRRVDQGPVLDLFAGVGLFAVALTSRGTRHVTAVERDRSAVADLRANATAAGAHIEVVDASVEDYLGCRSEPITGTVIVDPPRAGLSVGVIETLVALEVQRLVYVACDVATFARDLRRLREAGYILDELEAFDMFPNTAHVELVATFATSEAGRRTPSD